jgi:hypothetical protein
MLNSQAVCLNFWHTARTPIHTPQDMSPEVSSQSPSPEQTLLHRAMTTWNSIQHQVTHARTKIRFLKTDTNAPYGTAGTVKQHIIGTDTRIQTHDNIGTIHTRTHCFCVVEM